MDSRVVCGVGNIYASEALYRAAIHPLRAAGRISLARYEALVAAVRSVLEDAIAAGGTTLRDFRGADGRLGYFTGHLAVYGRSGQPVANAARRSGWCAVANAAHTLCPVPGTDGRSASRAGPAVHKECCALTRNLGSAGRPGHTEAADE